MKRIDYQEDVKIDPDNLDIECLKLPEIEEKYINYISDLRRTAKEAEEEVKTVRSELIREANENPQDCCSKSKPNAGDIEAYYRTHTKYKVAKQTDVESQDALQTAVDMKDLVHFTKGKALEHMIHLLGQNYWAGPDEPIQRDWKSMQDFKSERREGTDKKTGKGMKRKK